MIKLKLLFVGSIFFFLSCSLSTELNTDTTRIVAGNSKITGKIITADDQNNEDIVLTITTTQPITGETVRHEVVADQSGEFSLDFDMEVETSILGLYTSVNPDKGLYIKTMNNRAVHADIAYDSNHNIKYVNVIPAVNKYDMLQSTEVLNKLFEYRPDAPDWEYPHWYNKTADKFLDYVKTTVSKRSSRFIDDNDLFSNEFKDFLAKDYRLLVYAESVFDYTGQMMGNYRIATRDTMNTPNIQKIDRSYFRFLKDLNLNDPGYLHTFTFSEFQDSILRNDILALPVIGDEDIPSWLTKVKDILADLIGFDEGPYYDILASNAYGRQLNVAARPLSEKQKENITCYWKDGEIAKILFRKNEKVIEYDKLKSPTVVNDISSVPKEQVMAEIITKYKNKVVFIDLWATWCAPCLTAIKQFKSAKTELHGKDIVFVYLTNGSSPLKLWEEQIEGIGDEHYYLSAEQWEFVMDHFEFEYIPSYLLYSNDGDLVNKYTAFPGNDTFKEEIGALF